ncbi:MAG TPA: acyl-CoA dehydrogenase family protein [Acidimicrobiales bacterium]
MRFTEDHDLFRKMVRDVVDREINPHVDEWEAAGRFPAHELFPILGAAGLLGIEYDPAYGGQGADHSFTVVYGEEIGRIACGGVPMAISVQSDMATPSLHRYGSEELKQHYLVPAVAGRAVAAVAVTEADAGSDVAGLRTRARRDGDQWVIDGTKLYITNGAQADWVCVLARTSDDGGSGGISQIIVPTDTPGFSVSRTLDKLGMRSSDPAELVFDGVRVPAGNLIGEEGRGFQQQMEQFQQERMIACYQAVGSMEQAMARTREYLRDRQAFGGPLYGNDYLAYTLAELSAEVDLLKHYNHACAEAFIAGADTKKMVAVAKLTTGRLLRRVADLCLQYHGGVGYMEEHWTARYLRDQRLWAIGGGTDEIMLRTIAQLDAP